MSAAREASLRASAPLALAGALHRTRARLVMLRFHCTCMAVTRRSAQGSYSLVAAQSRWCMTLAFLSRQSGALGVHC